MEKGWGKEISKADFYHVHVCGKHKNYMFSLDEILSEDNVRLLYHTLETLFLTPDHANRNIISSLKLPPTLMPIHLNCIWGKGADYNMRGPGQIAIHSSDLGLAEYFKIEFEESSDGCCRLKNGSRLNMTGVLPSLLPHIRIENGTIEFNGRTIGQNETFLDLLLHA